jgi:hypothetical protein
MSAHKTTWRVATLGLTIVALAAAQLTMAAGGAAAFTGYGDPSFFGTTGSGGGQFERPEGVAVNEETGDVYVYDSGNLRVEWFDSTGTKFEGQFNGGATPAKAFASNGKETEYAKAGTLFNLAIDNDPSSPSKNDVYVVDPGHNVIDKFSATGAYITTLSGFTGPVFGVAVDKSGNVWVAEEGTEEGVGPVQEFNNEVSNKHIVTLQPKFKRHPGIAVDSERNIYLVRGFGEVAKFNQQGELIQESVSLCDCATCINNMCDTGVTIDPVTDGLFVDQETAIARFGPHGEPYRNPIETVEGITGSRGIAVNGKTHTLYAGEQSENKVAIFKTVLLPGVTTAAASEVHRTTAKLEGEVDPEGQEVTTCAFEYVAESEYEPHATNPYAKGKKVSCTTAPGSGTSSVPVNAEATGLTQETTYHYRLVAGNSNRTRLNPGEDKTFTTQPAIEKIKTEPASNIQEACATLNGSFESNGIDTHYWFEYASGKQYEETHKYSSVTPTTDGGSAAGATKVSATICALTIPDETYHYRIVGENEFGKTNGQDNTLRSAVLPPKITTPPIAEFVTSQTAVLFGSLNPEHTTTRYHFEYGPCEELSECSEEEIRSTPVETSAVDGTIGVSAEITGLSPSTVYSFRLVANNEFEESKMQFGGSAKLEAEELIETLAAPVPSVETGSHTQPTATSTTIFGTLYPNGVPSSYTIELGLYNGAATQYGIVASGSAGAGTTPVVVSQALTGLQPGTEYAYRVSVISGYISNETHSLQGATGVFTTLGLPIVIESPAPVALLATPAVQFPKPPAPAPKCKKGFKPNGRGKCVKEQPRKRDKARKVKKSKKQKRK